MVPTFESVHKILTCVLSLMSPTERENLVSDCLVESFYAVLSCGVVVVSRYSQNELVSVSTWLLV